MNDEKSTLSSSSGPRLKRNIFANMNPLTTPFSMTATTTIPTKTAASMTTTTITKNPPNNVMSNSLMMTAGLSVSKQQSAGENSTARQHYLASPETPFDGLRREISSLSYVQFEGLSQESTIYHRRKKRQSQSNGTQDTVNLLESYPLIIDELCFTNEERRIYEALAKLGVRMADPMEKQYDYYQKVRSNLFLSDRLTSFGALSIEKSSQQQLSSLDNNKIIDHYDRFQPEQQQQRAESTQQQEFDKKLNDQQSGQQEQLFPKRRFYESRIASNEMEQSKNWNSFLSELDLTSSKLLHNRGNKANGSMQPQTNKKTESQ